MKKLITFILFINYVLVFSQKNINEEIAEAEKFTNQIIENNPDKILHYYKLDNGTLKRYYPDNDNNEDAVNDILMSYRIIKKNHKIIYISKSDNFWGGIGDWYNAQDFYFDKNGILLGAVKKEEWFLENKCAQQIKFRGIYLNYGNPKLDRKDKFYNENDKEINLDSPNCKSSKKKALEIIEQTDKIAFKDLEGFMKAEKIKYYRTDENEKNIEYEKENPSIGSLIKGREKELIQENENSESKIDVNRKLISFIPGTMRRGGVQPSHSCTARGSITIAYTVDKAGNVVSAKRSGGVSDLCIVSTSIGWIKKYVKAEKSNFSSSGLYRIVF
ncbi:hypothetical protein [Chryseobacterium culicis]|uniref:hypothetical protein n=1 Tax=Chryseobacterium culicis TaxID=680127 RepID=UPI001D0BEB14|nr:hypothetical protein [Chryseobacterium culicis]